MYDMGGTELHAGDTVQIVRSDHFSDLVGRTAKVSGCQNGGPTLIRVCFDDEWGGYFHPTDIVKVSSTENVLRDRQGNVIHFSDKVIVYMPNGSTEIMWEEAHVSSAQEGDGTVCVVHEDYPDYYCSPADIIVTHSKAGAKQLEYVCTAMDAAACTEDKINTKRKTSEKPKQWENCRLPRRRDNVYHPGLGEVVYVVKRVNTDVMLCRLSDNGRLTRDYMKAAVSEIYPIRRCYYKDGRWRPIK